MSGELHVRNRQRARAINLNLLRKILRATLRELNVTQHELGFHLVGTPEITRLNEKFLQHAGSTDVITFDYADRRKPDFLIGEVFVCVDEATAQAKKFRTTWQSELIRYVVHGILHLCGHNDTTPASRRKMKREEDRLLKKLARQFALSKLARDPKLRP